MRIYLLAALLGFGCAGSKSQPMQQRGPDAGAHAAVAAAPPVAAAAKACQTLSTCGDGGALYVSERECQKQLSERFAKPDVTADCYDCLAEVTCRGWSAVAAGDADECSICDGCCAPDNCTPGASSVPGSPVDPCPQNTPQCPAAQYDAVTTCDADGTWHKDTSGSIACKCLAH